MDGGGDCCLGSGGGGGGVGIIGFGLDLVVLLVVGVCLLVAGVL